MAECARGPACWARDSRCSAHQEHSRHQQVHGIEQTLRSSTAATAGRRSPAPPPAFVVATADALLPREAVARSRAPTGPRAQETAIGGRARRLRGVAAAQAAARTVPLSTIRDTLYFLRLSCCCRQPLHSLAGSRARLAIHDVMDTLPRSGHAGQPCKICATAAAAALAVLSLHTARRRRG